MALNWSQRVDCLLYLLMCLTVLQFFPGWEELTTLAGVGTGEMELMRAWKIIIIHIIRYLRRSMVLMFVMAELVMVILYGTQLYRELKLTVIRNISGKELLLAVFSVVVYFLPWSNGVFTVLSLSLKFAQVLWLLDFMVWHTLECLLEREMIIQNLDRDRVYEANLKEMLTDLVDLRRIRRIDKVWESDYADLDLWHSDDDQQVE